MLSFKLLDKESANDIVKLAAYDCDSADIEYLKRALRSFMSLSNEDIECAVAFAHGSLLVRVFDMGRYMFVYPIAVCDSADEMSAIFALRDYAVKEEITFIITDMPAECISDFEAAFAHTFVYIQDEKTMSYYACAFNELSVLSEIPTVVGERIELSPLCENDTSAYAELCRDKNVNKYWNYDYISDVGENVTDDYFLNEALEEYKRGTALTLAVRIDGELVGDVVFHSFNLQERADIGFRLMKSWQGKGLGRELIKLIFYCAKKIGLKGLIARVMEGNTPSLQLLRSVAKESRAEDGIHIFEIEI